MPGGILQLADFQGQLLVRWLMSVEQLAIQAVDFVRKPATVGPRDAALPVLAEGFSLAMDACRGGR